MTGSGKTTFAIRYLLNADFSCAFLFDDLGRFATRLKARPAYTERELELALPTRWVIFNPHRAFPGRTRDAFRYFSKWAYAASKRGDGKKLFVVDELWQWCTDDAIPVELAMLSQCGREENIELVTCTQRPELVNASITGACTELICFRLDEPDALRTVKKLGADPESVSRLPLGEFVARNRLSGGLLRAKIF